jgi:ferritin-like metal-binding protein YciE/SH3-like domain-containing protein
MNAAQQKIVQYLDEARATERTLVRVLQSQIAMTPRGSYRSALEIHLEETRDHAARVDARLDALDERSNPLMAIVRLAESAVGQTLALGKAPFDLLRGSGGEEKVLKNAKDACASESLEIATYTAIERLALSVGDEETAKLAASIRADEEKMLARVLREIPKLTEAVTRADLEDDPSYDVTATGAADSARKAGKATKQAARSKAAASKRNRRPTGKAPAAQAQRTAAAPDGDLPIPRYDGLTADEIIGRLRPLSQQDLAKIDSYERGHKNRTTVLSRIRWLRRNEASTADLAAGANGAGAAPDEHDELRASAAAGDAAAAFTLWERLRDTDPAAAEGWLRTAATSGDTRAALQLGMLLWERRDLDAAEGMLRTAAADTEGAHALGRLLWTERDNADGAVHWLDRAARTDDPAAERDLGIVLRERGDLNGARHWLSRAAERDDQAREVLASLGADR